MRGLPSPNAARNRVNSGMCWLEGHTDHSSSQSSASGVGLIKETRNLAKAALAPESAGIENSAKLKPIGLLSAIGTVCPARWPAG